MATAVPSRFAVLSIEDDDYKPKKTQKNATTSKNNAKSKSDKSKPQQQQQPNKKKQNKGKKKKTNNDDQQWEQWKQKDTMVKYEFFIKATMSLEEFNSMGTSATVVPTNEPTDKSREVDTEFFERVEKETKEEITKGKEKDILKARLNKIDDDITFAQLRVEIEKRDEVIGQLRAEVHMLKEELTQVKERNKKLYQILSHGESKYHIFYASNACICKLLLFVIISLLLVKDKASVLAEVAKLQEIRDELTSEVASLHAQLEQERSKTRTSSVDVKTSKQTVRTRYIVSIFL
ncbi:GKAP1 protein, partial [Acromyrmex heyeri]